MFSWTHSWFSASSRGQMEKVNFSLSQSEQRAVGYSAHPSGPTSRRLISQRWGRGPRSHSVHQQVSQSENCSTDNRVSLMPLGHLVVGSIGLLANQREWLSINQPLLRAATDCLASSAAMVYSCAVFTISQYGGMSENPNLITLSIRDA